VVSGHDDDLALAAEPFADRAQHGLSRLHRLPRATLGQLDDVAEEDQPRDAVESLEQRLERLAMAQHVTPEPGSEVEIGDHEGPHAGREDATPAVDGRRLSPGAAAS
jgi:hypothetical protein